MNRFILFVFLFFLNSSSHVSANIKSQNKNHEYSGVYEMFETKKIGGTIYNKKLLRRLHIYKVEFSIPTNKYTSNQKSSSNLSFNVIGVLEVYDNKKGKGNPTRWFFTAKSVEKNNQLYINEYSVIYKELNGDFKELETYNYKKFRKFNIPNSSNKPINIELTSKYKGNWNKISTYEITPTIFDNYFKTVIKKFNIENKDVLKIASESPVFGRGGKGYFYTIEKDIYSQELKVFFQTGENMTSKLQKPSTIWLENVEKQMEKCLNDNKNGLHKILHYFPKLETLEVFLENNTSQGDFKGVNHFYSIKIKKNQTGLIYETFRTEKANQFITIGNSTDYNNMLATIEAQKKEKEKFRLAVEKTRALKEQKKIAEIEKKEKLKRYNPSNIILPSGEVEFYNDISNANGFKRINVDKYFKDIFYGNFNDLKPEKVSRTVLGTSNNYFPDFHNLFLYYANIKYGNNYYPSMTSHSFGITHTKRRDGFLISEYTVDYEVYFPKGFEQKFKYYLNKEQWSWMNIYDFKDLINTFLEKYNPDSLAFKQMMQNLYRFSNGFDAVTEKTDLKNTFN